MPSASGRIGSARKASRRSGVQPGGSYGNSRYGPPPTPAATCRLASRPSPFVQVCGVNHRPRASASSRDRPVAEHADRPARRRAGRRRRRPRRARHSASRCVRVISPPAMRIPRPAARSAASPRRSVPSSGSSSHSTSSSASRAAISRAGPDVDRRRRVAGHPPALVEVDHDGHRVTDRRPRRGHGGEALVEPARVDADLQRAEALVAQAQRRLGPLGRRQQHPARGIGGDRLGRAAEQRRHRQAGDLAGDVPQGGLERPVPAGMEVDRLEDPDVAGDGQRVLADEQVRRTPRTRPSCRPSRSRPRPRRSRPARP